MAKPIIKLFSKENVRIHITDFELLKISFYLRRTSRRRTVQLLFGIEKL